MNKDMLNNILNNYITNTEFIFIAKCLLKNIIYLNIIKYINN